MDLAMSIRAKGVGGLTARAGTILGRFGPTPRQMERRLHEYADLAASFGTQPTWPITACVLARHPHLIRGLADRGVEFAIHGLVHNDHARLSFEQQRATLAQARRGSCGRSRCRSGS